MIEDEVGVGQSGWKSRLGCFGVHSHVAADKHVRQELTGDVEKDDEDRAHLASSWGTGRSLINAAVSGGVLALAFQIPRAGSVMTVMLLVISCGFLYETLMMLYKACLHFQVSSYTGLAKEAWGLRAAQLVATSLGLGQFGVLVGYANVMSDTIPWVLQFNIEGCVSDDDFCDLPWYLETWFIITVLMVTFIGPISFRSNPDIFASISFTTFIHFALFLCLVLYGSNTYWPSNRIDLVLTEEEMIQNNLTQSPTIFPEETNGVFRIVPASILTVAIIAFAAEAHTTGLPILFGCKVPKGASRETKIGTISKVTFWSFVCVLFYYVLIMLGCYIGFGNSVEDNCLNSFPESSVFAMVVRCTYAFELGTSIPIYIYSMRRDLTAAYLGVDGNQAEMDKIESDNAFRTNLFTLFLLVSSTALGILGSLSLILGFTGALVVSFNTFVFPAALYHATNIPGFERHLAKFFIVFGLFVTGVSLYAQLDDVFDLQ